MMHEITLRTYQPGDPSKVCLFQYDLYKRQYGFNGFYEQEMLRGMAELYDDTAGSQMWIAEMDGRMVGDIAVVRKGEHRAQLRWLGVDMDVQGRGLGRRLLEEALGFCREHGYHELFLGTLDLLQPARHLYAEYGFHLMKSEPYNEWDKSRDMQREIWTCALA